MSSNAWLFRMKRRVRALLLRLPLNLGRRALYWHNYRRLMSLRAPAYFNEKVQWRIIKDRRDLLVVASGKVSSKEYVRSLGAPVSIPRTLWHGADLAELDEVEIHGDWVLKPSHRSGEVYFGRGQPDIELLRRVTVDWLRNAEWDYERLWAYSKVPAEFIMEERLPSEPDQDGLPDYKFFVFDGRVHLIQVDYGRRGDHSRVLFDRDWRPLPYVFTVRRGVPTPPSAPHGRRLVQAAERLGRAFDFVRVDLYVSRGQLYFGELTVYPGGGLSHWPEELDYRVGQVWRLPIGVSAPSSTSDRC